MNSDLTQTGSVPGTDNPQGVSAPAGASKASDFQQAAGPEVLSQNHSISVADNGQRITPVRPAGTDVGTYMIIIIGAIIFFFISKRLFAWVQAAPPEAKVDTTPAAVIAPKAAPNKKSKKQSRAERNKSK